MSSISWRYGLGLGVLVALLAPSALAASTARQPTLIPPKVIYPAQNAHIRAGTHINFKVRTFPHDQMLWLHISKSKHRDSCGMIADEVHIYDLKATSPKSAVYRTHTTRYTFPGFWMATPGKYYWQAYRIEHHFNADGCIETPVMKLVLTR